MSRGQPGGADTDLIARLGVAVDAALLETALTHASYAHENPAACPGGDNERLEFLGDAVLQLAVGALLYRNVPEASAGELTRLRAAVVSEEALWRVAEELHLGEHLRLGRGEEASGGRRRRSLLADAFEAVTGAVYLSGGLRRAEKFVRLHLGPAIRAARRAPLLDAKTSLQELAQARAIRVEYRLVSTSGPDHSRRFEVEVLLNGTAAGRGSGASKREAERAAAAEALKVLVPGDETEVGRRKSLT